MKKNILSVITLSLLLLIGALVSCFASELAVTNVRSSSGSYSITFNNSLVVKSLKLKKVGDNYFVMLPEYVAKNKRVYPQARVLTKEANVALIDAMLNGKTSTNIALKLEYAVKKISQYQKKSNLKAFVTIVFNEALELEFKLISTRNGFWLAPASIKTGDKYKQIVDILDKDLSDSIEREVIDKYNKIVNDEY